MTDVRAFPPRPIVGVGAAIVDAECVLVVRRGRPPLEGEWSLPGGAVEVGETLVAAIQREVLEETGLVVAVGPMIDVLDRIHLTADGRVEYHYVLVDYVCTAIGGWLQPESDVSDARWVTRSELLALAVAPLTVSVIDKAFHLGAGPS